MIKMKSIINLLQNEQVINLNSDESEFIVKDSPNTYLVVSNYFDNGSQYCTLPELKSFINHHETLFIDMFGSDTKFINRKLDIESMDDKLNDRLLNEPIELFDLRDQEQELKDFRINFRKLLKEKYQAFKNNLK
jgi:hypothetical protein